MYKKIILTTVLSVSAHAQAERPITYDYFEVGLDYLNVDSGGADGFYLDASFELGESFYLGGFYDRDDLGSLDLDQYGVFLGRHTTISDRTDFYSQINIGRWDIDINDSNTYGLDLGTRTAFSEKFELKTILGYTHIDKASDGYFKLGLEGLFKLNDKSGITLGLENLDFDDYGANIGYRFSF